MNWAHLNKSNAWLSICLCSFVMVVILLVACTATKGQPGITTTTTPVTSPATSQSIPNTKLNASITRVDISPDGHVTVYYKLTDIKGAPVSRASLDANRERFSIGRIVIDPETNYTQWLSYITQDVKGATYKLNGKDTAPVLDQVIGVPISSADSTGDFNEVGKGQYTYTFKAIIPVNFDKNATHRVIYQASADNRKTNINATFDFVPAGGPVKVTRQVVATENCNKCHDPLAAHGGSRTDTKMCVICHTPQNIDPASGNSVDFKVYIHKIHDASNLTSVKAGKTYNVGSTVFTDIVWPQDVRNCTTCHSNAPNADNWKTAPSRAACGSCHDNIDWVTGKSSDKNRPDHAGGPQTSDRLCKVCHSPDSGREFDASIVGAHVIPVKSKQLSGVNLTLKEATVKPGEKAVITFNIKDNDGNVIDPTTLDAVQFIMGYPTTDYSNNANGTAEYASRIMPTGQPPFVPTGVLATLGGGDYSYTWSKPVDSTWKTGTVAIGMIAYKNTTIKGNYGKDTTVRETSLNPVIYASLDATPPIARRTVVDRDKCNVCHFDFGSAAGVTIHGGSRKNTQLCVICHNPNQTDESHRTAATMPPESVQFKYMIHSIHIGDKRATPTIFSSLNTADIAFPGNGADCAKCHTGDSYTLPLPAGTLPLTITQAGKVFKVIQPIAAACQGCHAGQKIFDADVAKYTTAKGETCADCHARGQAQDVAKVHQPQ